MNLICKKIAAKLKKVKTGWSANLTNSSEERYGSERALFSMIMIIFRVMKAWFILMKDPIYTN
jgi:hypothetical protein